MQQRDITKAKSQVAKRLKDKFSNKGDFTRQIRKAKRHLPRKAAANAEIIQSAEANLKHPRLRKLVDKRQVAKAKRDLVYATDQADPAAARSKFWYGWFSSLIINLFIGMAVILGLAKLMGAY